MSKRKKVNPNRRPVSAAQLKRERKATKDAFLLMSLYALHESGANVELIQRFERKFEYVADGFLSGKLSVDSVTKVLETEYENEIRELEKRKALEFFIDADLVEESE